ncbi:hypothetical protein [Salinispira pacifica]
MKARLVPVHFGSQPDEDFTRELQALERLLGAEAEFLQPVPIGTTLTASEGNAALFPQMLGSAYRHVADFKKIDIPILVITSEFATVSMWDWEINSYLRREGIRVSAPYNLDQAKKLCRALAVRADLLRARFIVYQDNPGEGFQPAIFKRFYWWEDECTRRMFDKFGITVEKRSFRQLGEAAKQIDDAKAEAVWQEWKGRLKIGPMPHKSLLSALKIYIKVKSEIEEAESGTKGPIRGVGINCLNESHFSDTTPCLAWNMLYEERKLIWGCEADTVSMLTKYLLNASLGVPVMMTNMYPFLMGDAALKHERIPYFPEVDREPENHILAAHCGYLGVVPQSFSTEWTLQKKVLAIVDDNATAIDARMPEGPMTLVKIESGFDRISVVEGELEQYAQFENSDCLNGAVLKVKDGPALLNRLASHHYILTTGHNAEEIELIAGVFELELNRM